MSTTDHNHTHQHDHSHDHHHDGHTHGHSHDHDHHHDGHAHEHGHGHGHDHAHPHVHGGVTDYVNAVNEYRKTFADKQMVIRNTPDPAVREMLLNMEERGLETIFDRFDKQKPQCTFGLAGVCCKNCFMGPCKITPKAPRGVCGADADLIVARNLLRHVAAGTSAHGARGRESMLALKKAAAGEIPLPIEGEAKVMAAAKAFKLDTEGKDIRQLAGEIADILLDDLSRPVAALHRTIDAFATPERKEVWRKLDILPVSTYHEVMESLHRTSTGTDGDWRNEMQQFLRTGVAFAWSSCLGSSIAMDCLYGLPTLATSKINVGALEKGWVNIAVHGHSPLLVSAIVKLGQTEEYQALAREAGAKGIKFFGICCSGLSAMYRYGGVIPLSNAVGSELVLGTGALDLWVADVQDVFPTIMEVAKCFRTVVVTTSDSARLPGAEHYGLEHDHSNMDKINEIAAKILHRAIEAHADRKDVPVKIPKYEVEAKMGFSVENIIAQFGSLNPVADALREGKILGIVNLVGCSNPRIVYERAVIDVAEILLKNNVLILTNGCASFPLLKLGYCSTMALEHCGDGLKEFLDGRGLPPVWHMGECLDNARASATFAALAGVHKQAIKDMPYAFASPEWSNEKGITAALAFRLLGINSYHSVYAPVQGSKAVADFLATGTKEILGSEMIVDVDHKALAQRIVDDLRAKRKALGWD